MGFLGLILIFVSMFGIVAITEGGVGDAIEFFLIAGFMLIGLLGVHML